MQRNRAVALILGIIASPLVIALGLGPLQSNSALNESFSARIDFLGAAPADFDTLRIGLASIEQFDRAGIELNPLLYNLKFIVEDNPNGSSFISITSKDPIREPYLNFLVELNWANGRLVREYTVLLDPPLYDSTPRQARAAPVTVAKPIASPPPSSTAIVAPTAPASVQAAPTYAAGGEIGPVVSNDTLWSLASAARPSEAVTVQQMMLALLRENPDAFTDNNINLLSQGAILRMPDDASMNALSATEAFAEVRRQHQLWEAYRAQVGSQPTNQPVGAAATPVDHDASSQASTAESRLEVVAPGGAESGSTPGRGADGGSELLREEIDARVQQTEDLSGKLTEAEEIIDLLQRQVNIKDEELAALQARLAELGVAQEDVGLPDSSAVTEDAAATLDDDGMPVESDAIATTETEAASDELAIAAETSDDDSTVVVDVDVDDAPPAEEPEDALEPDETAEVVQPREPAPVAARGFPQSLIPEQIAAMVPGGALTVLGAIAAIILGLFAIVISFLMKSRGQSAAVVTPPVVAATRPEASDDGSEDPTITAGTDIPTADDTAGATEAPVVEFDPNATVEAEAAPTEVPDVAVAAEDEADPLEEINVYLAYERFDQAEELVKRVISEYPDRHEYRLRLLEVYYSSNDRAAYESAAQELLDAVGDGDPLWDNAVAMWSEMSPDRPLFAEGAESDAAPAPDSASAFVDITADADDGDSIAGEETVAHAPGGDDDGDGFIDLTAAGDADGADETETIFNIDGEDSDVLDLTGGSDIVDLTADDEDGVFDITAGSDDDILDISGTGPASSLLDAEIDETGGGLLDMADSGGDLLDVTKSGNASSFDDADLLNVTSPGLRDDDLGTADHAVAAADSAELAITDVTDADDSALDFDISDTVAPAFDAAANDDDDDEILDITAGGSDDLLDFDIGGLDDLIAEEPTVARGADSAASNLVVDDDGTVDLDFDITMDASELNTAINVVETEDSAGGLEITMSSPDGAQGGPEISLQGSELDDFDFALDDGTTEMDTIAAGDTLDMGMVNLSTGRPATAGEASLDDLASELDDAIGNANLDDLEIEGFASGDELLDTVSLDSDDLPEIEFDIDDQTIAMPVAGDVERQSDSDEADTKLNLAKAYIELGDSEGARSILDEVAIEGSEAQQAEAQSLLSQLTG